MLSGARIATNSDTPIRPEWHPESNKHVSNVPNNSELLDHKMGAYARRIRCQIVRQHQDRGYPEPRPKVPVPRFNVGKIGSRVRFVRFGKTLFSSPETRRRGLQFRFSCTKSSVGSHTGWY